MKKEAAPHYSHKPSSNYPDQHVSADYDRRFIALFQRAVQQPSADNVSVLLKLLKGL